MTDGDGDGGGSDGGDGDVAGNAEEEVVCRAFSLSCIEKPLLYVIGRDARVHKKYS